MATPRVSPVDRTIRKWTKAYVSLRLEPDSSRLQRRADAHLRSLFHWTQDDLEDDDCTCEAHEWWREQLRIHRARRARN